MLTDARAMLGAVDREGIHARWAEVVADADRRRADTGAPVLPALADDERVVAAYVNHGRWVADCPECNAGMPVWPDGDAQTCCTDCRLIFHVDGGTVADRAAAATLLLERPQRNQNWDRHKGETVERLGAENKLLLGVAGLAIDDRPRRRRGHDAGRPAL